MNEHRPDRIAWGILVLLALIWGSSFILMKRGLYHDGVAVLSPLQVASARIGIAWLVLSPLLLKHGHWLRKYWRPLLFAGLLGNGIPAILFATAQTRIDSSLSGMLNGLTPLMTMLFGGLFFGRHLRGIHVIGVLLGLVGAAGLVLNNGGGGLPTWSWFALLAVLGTVCYGINGNLVKHFLHAAPPMAISVLALTFVGPACLVIAWNSGLPEALADTPHAWSSLGYVALLAVLSSAIALVFWNMLLQRASALWASSVTYMMPLVAIGWGVVDGELVNGRQWIMIGVVLSGVYLVHIAERQR